MTKPRSAVLPAALLAEIDTLERTADRLDRAVTDGDLAALKTALTEAEALIAQHGVPHPPLTADQQARLVIVPQRQAS